ncbi:MAG: hypothetical protein V7L01_33625 [Nostoc sp.]
MGRKTMPNQDIKGDVFYPLLNEQGLLGNALPQTNLLVRQA